MSPLRRIPCASVIAGIIVIAGLALPDRAFSWGSGHDDVMRAIIERLPPELRGTLTPEIVKEAVQHASHYPDSFEPFLAKDIGDAALARLTEARLKVRYDLHSERGAAMCFIMLVDAMREKHPGHTAHWIATLSHVIADMAACNHDPLVHTATYGWADWKLRLPGGADFSKLRPLLDLSGSARDPDGGAEAFHAAIERQRLHDDRRDASKALADVMLYGQTGAAYGSSRGVAILEGSAGWVDRQDPAARDLLWRNIGELGAWAVVRTLRDVEVATRFASAEARLELTPEIESAHAAEVEEFLSARHLADEALFAPILHDLQPDQAPATGVVLEPAWAMNGAMLGFSSRVQSVAIARSLQQAGQSFATFDVRQILADGLPSSKRVPRLIIVATSFHSYHSLKADVFDQRIADYLAHGGRVLWIMGNSPPAPTSFAPFTKAMQRKDAKDRLPVSDELFLGSRVDVVGSGLSGLAIAHSAHTSAGWQQPFCPWTFDLVKSPALNPLITLDTGHQALTVGAIDADSKRACVPIYALTPHLFEGSGTIPTAHEPALDSATANILTAVLKRMQ